VGSGLRQSSPARALAALSTASKLNPLSAAPGRLGGTIALETGRYVEAERRFAQATIREPGGWYGWLGRGLASSALGDVSQAHHDFAVAASINRREPVVRQALARAYSSHPLTPPVALKLLVETLAS
jgi:Flp pilus assembly protein TadD